VQYKIVTQFLCKGDVDMKRFEKEGLMLKNLRIKAGFLTIKEAALHLGVHWRTWQNWELGYIRSTDAVDMYLELYIEHHGLNKKVERPRR
jgi:DNA-binding transcriptional regulator YiaG